MSNSKPKMPIEETFNKTKKFIHKTFKNLKSFLVQGSKAPHANPIFSNNSNKINPKLQEPDNFDISFSKQWDSNEITKKNEENKQQYSKNSITKNSKEEKKYSRVKRENPSFRAANALAKKMKELEMMDVNDVDHVMDVEEVLHYYSHLKSPAYLEMVDNFFMDMYLEYNLPQPSIRSLNSSMRKVGPASLHSSMRSLGPLKI